MQSGTPRNAAKFHQKASPESLILVCKAGRLGNAAPPSEVPPDNTGRPRSAGNSRQENAPRRDAPDMPPDLAKKRPRNAHRPGASEAPLDLDKRRPRSAHLGLQSETPQKRRQTSSRGAPEAHTLDCNAGRRGASSDLAKRRPKMLTMICRAPRNRRQIQKCHIGYFAGRQGGQNCRHILQEGSKRRPHGFAGRGAHISDWHLAFGV